jgi:hypothetical protein
MTGLCRAAKQFTCRHRVLRHHPATPCNLRQHGERFGFVFGSEPSEDRHRFTIMSSDRKPDSANNIWVAGHGAGRARLPLLWIEEAQMLALEAVSSASPYSSTATLIS